jgi:hypothetical protein
MSSLSQQLAINHNHWQSQCRLNKRLIEVILSQRKHEPLDFYIWYIDIFLLTAIGLPPGGSCTVHIYTQTIHRTTRNKQYIEHKNKQYIEQHKNGRVRAVPRLCELYPGICLTTEEKTWKNLGQGSRTIRIHRPNNKNT